MKRKGMLYHKRSAFFDRLSVRIYSSDQNYRTTSVFCFLSNLYCTVFPALEKYGYALSEYNEKVLLH